MTTVSASKELRGQDADDIAAQPVAVLIRHQRAVAVAVGGDDGVEMLLPRPLLRQADILRANRLGIHRDEGLRAPERGHRRPQRGEESHQQIAPHRGMLVQPDRLAAEKIRRKAVEIAVEISRARAVVHRARSNWRCSMPSAAKISGTGTTCASIPASSSFSTSPEALLNLMPFRSSGIWLPVTMMAGIALLYAIERHRRRRDVPAIHREVAPIRHRATHGRHNACRAGAQITRDGHPAFPPAQVADGFQVLEKAGGIAVTDGIRHRANQPARAAGAEFHAGSCHQLGDGYL